MCLAFLSVNNDKRCILDSLIIIVLLILDFFSLPDYFAFLKRRGCDLYGDKNSEMAHNHLQHWISSYW